MRKNFRLGTRASLLALKQVDEIKGSLKGFYPDIELDVVPIETYGDRDKKTPISEIEGSDFFTREIDEALLKGEIDFAVHSAKDLPDRLKDGLCVAAITSSIDRHDCLVSKYGLELDRLPYAARIGTSSRRRKTQLKKFRGDFQVVDIRGNIEERLKLLDDRESPFDLGQGRRNIDAIVIAAVALVRLGLENRITQRIPFEIIEPHPLQGALAVVVRKDDIELTGIFTNLTSGGIR